MMVTLLDVLLNDKMLHQCLKWLLVKEDLSVIHQVNIAIKSKVKYIWRRHQKKLINFRNRQTTEEKFSENKNMKHNVHNFFSYQLSEEEYKVLSYGLDYHVSSKTKNNVINTEFEKFYQIILSNISHTFDDQVAVLKKRMPNTCHKYIRTNVSYRYTQIIRTLSNNEEIKVL